MTITIRLATAVDAMELAAIEVAAGERFREIDDLAWIADDDGMALQDHLKAIASGTEWVAVEGKDELVGFLSAEQFENALHIWEISVLPTCQGQGVGKKLMAVAEEHAAKHRKESTTLTTFRDVGWNEGFYAYLGYETLADDALSERLRAMLAEEVAHGLPAERRCAMRKFLG